MAIPPSKTSCMKYFCPRPQALDFVQIGFYESLSSSSWAGMELGRLTPPMSPNMEPSSVVSSTCKPDFRSFSSACWYFGWIPAPLSLSYQLPSIRIQKLSRYRPTQISCCLLQYPAVATGTLKLRPSSVDCPATEGSVFSASYAGTREQESQGRNKTGVNTGDIHGSDFWPARRMSLFRGNTNAG